MKEFKTVTFDPALISKELIQLGKLLNSKPSLSERGDLQPFFKKREHLSAFLGVYALGIGPERQLAYEFPFLGDFAADLIVGNRDQEDYLVVELEAARAVPGAGDRRGIITSAPRD